MVMLSSWFNNYVMSAPLMIIYAVLDLLLEFLLSGQPILMYFADIQNDTLLFAITQLQSIIFSPNANIMFRIFFT